MDKRLQGFLLALIMCVVMGKLTYAQQRNCVGEYSHAMQDAWNRMKAVAEQSASLSYWERAFSPTWQANYVGASIEYYARSESAWYQFLACSAIPNGR